MDEIKHIPIGADLSRRVQEGSVVVVLERLRCERRRYPWSVRRIHRFGCTGHMVCQDIMQGMVNYKASHRCTECGRVEALTNEKYPRTIHVVTWPDGTRERMLR